MAEDDYAGDVTPREAWDILSQDPKAKLVDVRTRAEWAFVGVPDLSGLGKELVCIEWIRFPDRERNADFVAEVAAAAVDRDAPLMFICRSGQRSRAAAIAMTAAGFARCYNVSTGFEGNHDEARHRGSVGGWKVDGLPWVQG